MADWVNVLVNGGSGLIGAVIGAGAMILGKRFFDADYLKYRDEKKKAECMHVFVESERAPTFCRVCKKTFTSEETAIQRVLDCEHEGNIELLWRDEEKGEILCRDCGYHCDVVFRQPGT